MPGWTLQHRDTATLEERRLRGLGLLSEGRSQAEVARLLGVTPAAVCYWKRAIGEGGPKALRAVPRPVDHPSDHPDHRDRVGRSIHRDRDVASAQAPRALVATPRRQAREKDL